MTKKVEKSRYFTFLLYPESIPEDWLTRLEMIGMPMAISPLHDSDKSTIEGQEFKKPHYHVIYIANNSVTAESVRLKIKRALGDKSIAKVQIIITSVENSYLYLTHESKDAIAKNKHVYNKKDIILLNNFDIDRYVIDNVEDKEARFQVLCNIIKQEELANIIELSDFIELRGSEYGIRSMKEANDAIMLHTYLIKLYFDGVYQNREYGSRNLYLEDLKRAKGELIDEATAEEDARDESVVICDKKTGEVLAEVDNTKERGDN